jgi:hypothetical protein
MHIQLQRYDPQIVLEDSRADRSAEKFEPFGGDGVTFSDILDLINPLQHIPIVGSLYRKITGDSIDPAMRVAGGLYLGVRLAS